LLARLPVKRMKKLSDIDLNLIAAERLALQTIEEFGVCLPEHIRVRDIAFAKNAVVIERPLKNAAASIVKAGSNATIRISPTDSDERKRFSIAHELGHLLMGHVTSIKKICSDDDMRNWYQKDKESQANFFASELLLPSPMMKKRCDVEKVNFDPIKLIAKEFRTSLTATAIKFVRLNPEKCAVVYSANGKIDWFYKSPDWWPFIRRGKDLDKRTVAYDLFHGELVEAEPVEVDADAWIENNGLDEVVEHSIISSHHNFVLTVLWIKP